MVVVGLDEEKSAAAGCALVTTFEICGGDDDDDHCEISSAHKVAAARNRNSFGFDIVKLIADCTWKREKKRFCDGTLGRVKKKYGKRNKQQAFWLAHTTLSIDSIMYFCLVSLRNANTVVVVVDTKYAWGEVVVAHTK
jgi:hypothetical protein